MLVLAILESGVVDLSPMVGEAKGIFLLLFLLSLGALCSVMNLWHMELRLEKVRLK